MRSILLCGTILFACASASAQVAMYEHWDQSPQAFFMTRAERRQWQHVRPEEQAAFVSKYIARRGGLAFTNLVESRVALAERFFGTFNKKGVETLRGRLVVLFGAPSSMVTSRLLQAGDLLPDMPPEAMTDVSIGGFPASGGAKALRVHDHGRYYRVQTLKFAADKLPVPHDGDLLASVEIDEASGTERWSRGTNEKAMEKLFEAVAAASVTK
ncbi:MAG TPA: GWxTD domain-containing protein [Thermoanaerobaculia bacterium]